MVKLTRGLVVLGMAFAVVLPAGVAAAADDCTYPATCTPSGPIEITTQGRPGTIAPETGAADTGAPIPASASAVGAPVSSAGATAPASESSLPVTGGDIAGLTMIGVGAMAAGAVLTRRHRKL